MKIALATHEDNPNINNQHKDDDNLEFTQTRREQLITFHDQGQVAQESTVPRFTDLPMSYLNMTIAKDVDHTVKSFLERPIRLFSTLFTTSQTVGTDLWVGTFPEDMFVNPMYLQKLEGFTGLRADLELVVQVNAQKFQCGRLRLQFFPYAQDMPNKVELTNGHLAGRVACPGIDIDICGGSTPESRISSNRLRIKYNSPHTFLNLINGDGKYGKAYLFVYSPLLTGDGGSQDCEVTIWARFIDPRPEFPTGAVVNSGVPDMAIAQVAGEAKEVAQTGVVSNTLGVVADTLKVASKIPVVGEYLSIPQWVCEKGSSIAKLFGWSKPTLAMDTKLRTSNNFANYNGKDSSHKMALSADNEIDTPKGIGGTDIDEMAISSVASIPTFWDRFTWSTTDNVADQILWVDPVTAAKFRSTAGNGYTCTHMGYLANVFAQWRGSINYTFKMVKTGFHSGRLRVFFVPQGLLSTLVVGSAPTIEIEKCYQVVIDIAENDSFQFNVPFVATKPWLTTTGASSVTGYIVVTVLNDLRAPPVVTNAIDVIVEVSGGNDLTFSLPTEPTLLPGIPTVPTVAEAQVAGTNVAIERDQAQTLVDPSSISIIDPQANWSPESHCIGEKICSIRQLIKRNGFVGFTTMFVDGSTASGHPGQSIVLNPYAALNSDSASNSNTMDYVSYFQNIYTFFRGSMRFKTIATQLSGTGVSSEGTAVGTTFYSPALNDVPLDVKMWMGFNSDYISIIGANRKVNNIMGRIGINQQIPTDAVVASMNAASVPTSLISQRVEGMTEFEVPYYNSTHLTLCQVMKASDPLLFTDPAANNENTWPIPFVTVSNVIKPYVLSVFADADFNRPVYDTSVTSIALYRSAGDDYGLHYLIGPPTLITRNFSSQYYTPSS